MKYKLSYIVYGYLFDTKASIALWAGLSIGGIIIASGMSIDFGYAALTKQRVNNAMDAAAFAVAKYSADLTEDQQRRQIVSRYIGLNTVGDSSVMSSITDSVSVVFSEKEGVGSTVQLNVDGSMSAQFMGINSQIDELKISALSEVLMMGNFPPSDIVMSLDTSTSMEGGNMKDLDKAMAILLDGLFKGNSTSEYYEIANVTFSGNVKDVTPWTNNRSTLESYYDTFFKDEYASLGTNNGVALEKAHEI
jgi:Flp pilus assembly protein TadG